MRVKKRVKRGVKKGIKGVKSAPPGAYVAGGGVLVGVAAALLLATTKSGQELLNRTVQRLLPEPQEPEEDANADESEVTDLKPREQRPSPRKAPAQRPSPRKAPAPPKATNA